MSADREPDRGSNGLPTCRGSPFPRVPWRLEDHMDAEPDKRPTPLISLSVWGVFAPGLTRREPGADPERTRGGPAADPERWVRWSGRVERVAEPGGSGSQKSPNGKDARTPRTIPEKLKTPEVEKPQGLRGALRSARDGAPCGRSSPLPRSARSLRLEPVRTPRTTPEKLKTPEVEKPQGLQRASRSARDSNPQALSGARFRGECNTILPALQNSGTPTGLGTRLPER